MRHILCCLFIGAALTLQASAATVDGLKIHSSSAGKARQTVILVHGWTCDSTSWTAQIGPLSKTYRVVTLDLPGHGLSGSPADGKFSVDLFARAVEAVRAEANADKVVLVGHSMGAPVIRQYARLYPQHVAGLVAVDGPLAGGPGPAPQRGEAPRQFPVVTGPDGLKARENMIRGMFTPQTPAALQQQILTMMLKAPEVDRRRRDGGDGRPGALEGRRRRRAGSGHLCGNVEGFPTSGPCKRHCRSSKPPRSPAPGTS